VSSRALATTTASSLLTVLVRSDIRAWHRMRFRSEVRVIWYLILVHSLFLVLLSVFVVSVHILLRAYVHRSLQHVV